MSIDRVLPSSCSHQTSPFLRPSVKSLPLLTVNERTMHGVLNFIFRMTEHDVLVTGAIKSRIAFLQLLTDCLFSSNHRLAFNLHQLRVDLCDAFVLSALTLEADGVHAVLLATQAMVIQRTLTSRAALLMTHVTHPAELHVALAILHVAARVHPLSGH